MTDQPTPLESARNAIPTSADDKTAGALWGIVTAYEDRWRHTFDGLKLLESEVTYTAPIINTATKKPMRIFTQAGKLDTILQDGSYTVLMDHKTTSDDIGDPDSTYWRQLIIEGQPKHYEILLLANGKRVDRIAWDVVKKPGIRPKQIDKKSATAITSLHEYVGYKVSNETQQAIIDGKLPRENAELYGYRVAREMLDNQDKYFQRRSVTRLDHELVKYADEIFEIAHEINGTRKSGRHFRNSGACMQWGRPCVYLGLCSGHDTEDSDNWLRREAVHRELDDSVGDGRNVLTNSRIKCYQTCRRKHYYQYEMGLERVREEEAEALYFGTLWHEVLDVLFHSYLKGQSNVTSSNGHAVNAVASPESGRLAEGASH